MNKHRKQAYSILFLLICCLFVRRECAYASSMGTNGMAAGLAPRKIISVVYDDSGSMTGTATESANYAVQVFEALMGSRDELYITYMSDVEDGNRISHKVDLQNIEQAVTDFRNRQYNYRDTPLAATEVAFETLQKISENDENTQFWLVILTDGAMDDTAPSKYNDLDNLLSDIKGTRMSNNSQLHIYYFGIGDGAKAVSPDPGNELHAVTSTDIVPTLGDIANVVSGRIKYGNNEVQYIDDHTVRVTSHLPLFSLGVFTQRSNARVVSGECKSEEGNTVKLQVDRNVRVEGMSPNEQQLFGNVAVISNDSGVIPSGEYTLTFSEGIDKNNTVVMFQPAISLKLEVIKGGTVVTDYSALSEGDDLEFTLTAIDMFTGQEIDSSRLPQGTKWEITWDNGSGPHTTDGSTAKISDISPGDYVVKGRLSIPQMVPIDSNQITFHIDDYAPEFKLRLTITKKGNIDDVVLYDNVDGVNDLTGLEASDLIDVRLEAFDNLTGEPIDAARLGAAENYDITYEVNGIQEGTVSTQTYDNISLKAGSNRIVGDYECAGNVLQEIVEFEVAPMAVYDLETEDNEYTFHRGSLKAHKTDKKTPLVWILRDEDADQDGTGDGNPVRLREQDCTGNKYVLFKSQEIKNLDNIFILNHGLSAADTEIVLNSDGSFSIYPTKHSGLIRRLAPYSIRTGEYHVTVQLDVNGKEAEVVYTVYPKWQDWIPLILELLFIAFLIWIIRILFFKFKFRKGSRIIVKVYGLSDDGSRGVEKPDLGGTTTLKPFGKHPLSVKPAVWVIPKLRIKVYADQLGGSYFLQSSVSMPWGTSNLHPKSFNSLGNDIDKKTKARQNKNAGLNGNNKNNKKKKLKSSKNQPIQVLGASPVYFMSEQSDRIYQVTLVHSQNR